MTRMRNIVFPAAMMLALPEKWSAVWDGSELTYTEEYSAGEEELAARTGQISEMIAGQSGCVTQEKGKVIIKARNEKAALVAMVQEMLLQLEVAGYAPPNTCLRVMSDVLQSIQLFAPIQLLPISERPLA